VPNKTNHSSIHELKQIQNYLLIKPDALILLNGCYNSFFMEILHLLLINLFITVLAFIINIKQAPSPYYMKKAIVDFLICSIPFINLSYIVYTFFEFIIDKISGVIKLPNEKINSFLNMRLK